MPKTIEIYTDGSCNNNRNAKELARVGGAGYVLVFGDVEKHVSVGNFANSNSARAEMLGILYALEEIKTNKYKMNVYCDCQHVVNTIESGMLESITSTVEIGMKKNSDIWMRLRKIYCKLGGSRNIKVHWVRGHDGNHYNECADKLAGKGRRKIEVIEDHGGSSV